MAFKPGDLCCSSTACVLLDIEGDSDTESWDLIPHVTQISTTQTANTPKLVTSSTSGNEISACGTVTSNGNLAMACHGGTGPGVLCINRLYRIRWSEDCDNIWDPVNEEALSGEELGIYFEAIIRITTVPLDFNIAGNQALIFNYSFDVYEWVTYPDCQTKENTE